MVAGATQIALAAALFLRVSGAWIVAIVTLGLLFVVMALAARFC